MDEKEIQTDDVPKIEVVQPEPADDIITKIVKTNGKYVKGVSGNKNGRPNTKNMTDLVLKAVRRKIKFKIEDEDGNVVEKVIAVRNALIQTWIKFALKGHIKFNLLLKEYLDKEKSGTDITKITVDDLIRAYRK